MILRRSQFIHQLPVGQGRTLIVHALSHIRLPGDNDVNVLLDFFAEPRRVPEDCAALSDLMPGTLQEIQGAIKGLVERQILTEKSPEEELADVAAILAPMYGRDPGEILEL